jgi:hypothetical protein
MTGDPKVLTVARDGFEGEIPAATPPGNPDVRLVVVSAARVVAIRVIRTYLQAFAGILTAMLVGVNVAAGVDPAQGYGVVSTAALGALFPAGYALLQNALELLAKWDVTQPELRG